MKNWLKNLRDTVGIWRIDAKAWWKKFREKHIVAEWTFGGTMSVLLGIVMWSSAGCASIDMTKIDPAVIAANVTPSNVVSIATNWLGNQTIIALADGIMSDPVLVANIEKAWAEFAARYDLPATNAPSTPDQPQGDYSTALPELSTARPLMGYGRVNRWANGGATMEDSLEILQADLEACRKHGVRIYTIEFASWGRYSANSNDKEWTEAAYKLLVDYCRENGMWVLVSAFNDNQGSGKYGDPGVDLEHSKPMIEWAIGVLKKHGPANILLQPVAETSTIYGKSLETSMAKDFAALGYTLVYNRGSRPKTAPAPFKYRATHPFKVTDSFPGSIVVSDTGTIIQSLNEGLEGKGKPAALKSWAKDMADDGVYAVVDYAFKWAGPSDEAAISAMGSAVTYSVVDASNAPTATTDDIDLSKAKWHGPNGANAAVTESMTWLAIDKDKISYTISKGTESWEPHSGEKNCNQYACFFVYRNGQFQGGKFDWSTYSRKTRELKNIRGKYTGGIVPASGEDVWFLFMDLNGTKRTNAKKVQWP